MLTDVGYEITSVIKSDVAAALSLIATMKNSGVNSGISGSTFIFATTDGGASWTFDTGNVINKYLPGSCK